MTGAGDTSASKRYIVTKTLGNKAYSINPFRLDTSEEKWTLGSLAVAALKPVALIGLSPLIVTFSTSFFALMMLGPNMIRRKVISLMIPKIMENVATKCSEERKILLSDIGENDRVLDVGSGGGAYLRHCSKAKAVVALEPVAGMHDKIRKSAQEAGVDSNRITVLTEDVETYLQNNPDERGTFDRVILGNVLCEVRSQKSTLEAVKIALKVGGQAYFSEHLGCEAGSLSRRIQDFINPMWVVISGGCNCNRDTMKEILSVEGWEVIWWQYEGMKVCMGPFVIGIAEKVV